VLRLEKLKSRGRSFERLVGLSPAEFDQLLIELEPLWERFWQLNLSDAGVAQQVA